jgi:hypothetical protein
MTRSIDAHGSLVKSFSPIRGLEVCFLHENNAAHVSQTNCELQAAHQSTDLATDFSTRH